MRRGRAQGVAERRFPLVWGFWIGAARKCRTKPSPSPGEVADKQISPRRVGVDRPLWGDFRGDDRRQPRHDRRRRRHPRARGGARDPRPAPGRARARRRARGAAGDAPEQPQLRRHPRRDLLRAGLAEGAPVRRRRRADVRLLRGQRDRRCGGSASSSSRCAATSCPRSTSSSGAGTPTACRACGAWTATGCATIEPHAAGIAALHAPGTAHRRLRRGLRPARRRRGRRRRRAALRLGGRAA